MRRLQLRAGAVVPHAPLLLREIAGSRAAAATRPLADAVTSLDPGGDVVVVASPHGRATGVYEAAAGNLDAFGAGGIAVDAPPDEEAVHALAAAWGRPVLADPADYGVVVPLRLLGVGARTVAVAFREGIGAAEAAEEGAALADALSVLDGAAFVASANLSAGLTEGAPLTSLEGAAAADARVLRALRTAPRALLDGLDALAGAGSCAAGPLAAFASLFQSASCSVLAYGHPFGVGHVVAATS